MFTGFTDETMQFFLDLRFHNSQTYFHENHDRYVAVVQKPFYDFIDALAPTMLEIDPRMEVRPHKCLSRIHRDTRFSKDKSPYRDHLWLCFRRAGESRDGSVNFFFEAGPSTVGWGFGTWGENREMNDRIRREIVAQPHRFTGILDDMAMDEHHLGMHLDTFKRMEIPATVPLRLRPLYAMKEVYIGREEIDRRWLFTPGLVNIVAKDFIRLAPMYKMMRGICDEIENERIAEVSRNARRDEW